MIEDTMMHSQETNAVVGTSITTTKSLSFVWQYYNSCEGKAVCTTCRKTLTINAGTTSNLIKHLKGHKITKDSYTSGSLIKLGKRQLTIQEAVDGGFDQKLFEDLLSVFIIKSDAPFLTIEHPQFISLLRCLNPRVQIPVATTCQRRKFMKYLTRP